MLDVLGEGPGRDPKRAPILGDQYEAAARRNELLGPDLLSIVMPIGETGGGVGSVREAPLHGKILTPLGYLRQRRRDVPLAIQARPLVAAHITPPASSAGGAWPEHRVSATAV